MREIIRNHISSSDLQTVVDKLSKSDIGTDIRKSCQLTFPLKICLIEKVKVLRKPKQDSANLLAMHDLTTGFDALIENDDDDQDMSESKEDYSGSDQED